MVRLISPPNPTYLVQLVDIEGEHFRKAFAHFEHVKVVAGLGFLELRARSNFQSCPPVNSFLSEGVLLQRHLLSFRSRLVADRRRLNLGCLV